MVSIYIKTEQQLENWLAKSFATGGTNVYTQVPFDSKRIDIVTEDRNKIVNTYELKLKNWKKALIQAYLNVPVSSKSYVVMLNLKNAEKHCELFRKNNIGLISINKIGKKHLVFDPQENDYSHPILKTELLKRKKIRT